MLSSNRPEALYFSRSCLQEGGSTLFRGAWRHLILEVLSMSATAWKPTKQPKWCLFRENKFLCVTKSDSDFRTQMRQVRCGGLGAWIRYYRFFLKILLNHIFQRYWLHRINMKIVGMILIFCNFAILQK